MFYAVHGKPNPDGGEVPDVFAYFLADRLGLTLTQVRAMPAEEYTAWSSYHKVRTQAEELAAKRHG